MRTFAETARERISDKLYVKIRYNWLNRDEEKRCYPSNRARILEHHVAHAYPGETPAKRLINFLH